MRLLVAGLVLCAALAGCTKHHASNPSPGPARPGGTLRVALAAVGSLDPMMATTPGELELATMLFAPLTTWDPVSLVARPGLAASWSASPDQRQWTFVLRGGATFSDGHPVTANDVVFSYSRIFGRGSKSPAASLLAEVSKVTAAGSSVAVTLSAPLAVLPDILGNPALGIVEQAAPPTGETPVGSGPFAVTAHASGNVTLARARGSHAFLDGMALTLYSDDSAAFEAFRGGAVDWAPVPPADAVGAAVTYHQTVSRPLEAELFYGFNLHDPVVRDVRLRQAVIHAVDRNALAAGAYRGTALPLQDLVPEQSGCGYFCAYDPVAARASLASVFGPTGPPALTIEYDQGPTQDAVADEVTTALERVGVFTNRKPLPAATFTPNVVESGDELFRAGWVARYPGPDGVLAPLFLTGQPDNVTGFSSAQVDNAIEAARAEPDPGKRAADYRDAEARIGAMAPILPLVQFESHAVAGAGVEGLVVNRMGIWDPSAAWLAAAR